MNSGNIDKTESLKQEMKLKETHMTLQIKQVKREVV